MRRSVLFTSHRLCFNLIQNKTKQTYIYIYGMRDLLFLYQRKASIRP